MTSNDTTPDQTQTAQTDAQTTHGDTATSEGNTSNSKSKALNTILDGVTDIVAVGTIGYIATQTPEPGTVVVGTIASIALGKKYLAK